MDIGRFVNRSSNPLQSLNCDGRYGLALVGLALALLLPTAGGATWRDLLRYDRTALQEGQWWRLLTAHFVHLDLGHALLNVTGAVLLWALFAREYRPRQWLAVTLVTIACIDAGLWFLQPQLQWYVGASGMLHGLIAAGAIAMLAHGDRLGWLVLVPFIAKLAWEQTVGPMPFESTGPVVTSAHAFGALGGALAALLLRLTGAQTPQRSQPL